MPMTTARRRELAVLAREAFLAGAVETWIRASGHPPTVEELQRVLRRYPGDPGSVSLDLGNGSPEGRTPGHQQS